MQRHRPINTAWKRTFEGSLKMSNEKNPEVAGCDASIMMNVWEIREREYDQKLQIEQVRKEKSALSTINQDWANRLAAKMGTHKRVEKKPKPDGDLPGQKTVWKRKQPQPPPAPPPRGVGSGPAGQSRGFSSPAFHSKDKKGQDKHFKRLQLLMSITQNQPSAMIWGKSWKYNKSLPALEECAISNWGECWMFATQQPYSEAGKPWLNGPNLMDPHSLHLWMKPDYRMVESQELDLSLPTEEWQMSWRKADKNKKDGNEENVGKSGFFTHLLQTQHNNEALCSSEWSDSWLSTKPASQQDDSTVLNDGQMNESVEKQGKDTGMSSKWEECWRLANHYGCKSKLPQAEKSHNPEWANSWRAAMVNNFHTNADPSVSEHSQQRESHLFKAMLVSPEQKNRDLYLNEFEALSEWNTSWQVTKNNSKPSEEIEKVLNIAHSRMETSKAQKVENNRKGQDFLSENPRYENLKNDVIYCPKRECSQTKLRHLKHMENILSASEWRESWKTLKHRMRMERRRMRPDPSRPFRAAEKGGERMPSTSEWKYSWKLTSQPMRQEPEAWQQGWSITPQFRVDRTLEQNHFAPVELPKNGPTSERSWEESWRFLRRQRQSEPGQGRAQTCQAGSSVATNQPGYSPAQRRVSISSSDWQAAWMVSETQFHHDRPSLTQWREAWRCSDSHTDHSPSEVLREDQVNVAMEIQTLRENISLQRANAKFSQSFDKQMFRERYPEKQWDASWKAGSLLNHQPSHRGSSGTPEKSTSCTTPQHDNTENGHGTKWGRSFRIANPMPPMEKPWVESYANPCQYTVMWSRGKHLKNNVSTILSSNPATFKLWGNSHQFLPGAHPKAKNTTMSKASVDPRVIITIQTKNRKHLYSTIEKEELSAKKLAGCHLLGKTQPRPKKGPVKSAKKDDKTPDTFFEEWEESWRFSVQPSGLRKPVKSLSGWNESWKFLIPPHQPMNGPKAK
ncbi:uncharacterized protein [Pseudochaenichthys georgianus]|uniref:uncharacterized protein isoform X1 n=2 Tax=Pseudochaenichthys georgianus TaxID=52239 RepID=UPI00146C04F4|nr:uncharacterized protein LOC117455815 isoform X1 [Pseudochaenichthys georgianus]